MNIYLNEYFGFCFELNFELNHFSARFNEKMIFQNVSNTPSGGWGLWALGLPGKVLGKGEIWVSCSQLWMKKIRKETKAIAIVLYTN